MSGPHTEDPRLDPQGAAIAAFGDPLPRTDCRRCECCFDYECRADLCRATCPCNDRDWRWSG